MKKIKKFLQQPARQRAGVDGLRLTKSISAGNLGGEKKMIIQAIKKALRNWTLRNAERKKWNTAFALMVDSGVIKVRRYQHLKVF